MREDHLKRQIDLLARALGKVLFGLLGAKTGDVLPFDEIIETARTEGGMDEDVFSLNEEGLLDLFRTDRRWSPENISALAEVFLEMGCMENDRDPHSGNGCLSRALFIFEYLNGRTHTYSADRQEKIHWLKGVLQKW